MSHQSADGRFGGLEKGACMVYKSETYVVNKQLFII